jgi:HK97 family phage prohead protease
VRRGKSEGVFEMTTQTWVAVAVDPLRVALVRLLARCLTTALRYLTSMEDRPIAEASDADDVDDDDPLRNSNMSTLETKFGQTIALDEKALSEDDQVWRFTGYASIFGSKDLGNDVVVEGAFAKSLREHGMPLLLFQHKTDECPVGVVTEAREDRRGLHIKGELPKDDAFCRDRLVPQLKRRGLKGMSIGYRALETEKRKSDGARLLKQIRLFECSFVSMPMHPEASVATIKTLSTSELAEALEEMSRAARELTVVARIDPVVQLAEFAHELSVFVKEARRDRPQLRDQIAKAEASLAQATARLQRLRDAAWR